MGPFGRRERITLGVVERALDADRRSGEERRDEPPKEKSSPLWPLLMFLLALVVAASTWNFTKLEGDYQGFKSDEVGRHERDAALHEKMDGRLAVLEKAETERAAQSRLQKAIARRLGVKVED